MILIIDIHAIFLVRIIEIYKKEKPINEIKLLNTRPYQILVGYRNSNYFCLFDIRKMNQYNNYKKLINYKEMFFQQKKLILFWIRKKKIYILEI